MKGIVFICTIFMEVTLFTLLQKLTKTLFYGKLEMLAFTIACKANKYLRFGVVLLPEKNFKLQKSCFLRK